MRFRELLESARRTTKFSEKITDYRTPKGAVSYDFEHDEDYAYDETMRKVSVTKYSRKGQGYKWQWTVDTFWFPKEKPTVGQVVKDAEKTIKYGYS